MKRIFIFPTIEEAKAFILTEPRDPVFVGGVGMAEIAAATLRAVKAKKPQLVVLAGIAGACDRTLRRGEVVEVVCERIAGIPERYAREYETSGPDLGLPLAAGVTVNRSGRRSRGNGRAEKRGGRHRARGWGRRVRGAAPRIYGRRRSRARSGRHPTPDARAMPETSRGTWRHPSGSKRRTIRNARRLVRNPEYRTMPATCRKSRKEARRIRRKSTCRKWRTWKAQPFRRMRRAGRRMLPDTRRVELRRRTLRPVGCGGGRREPDGKVKPNIRKQ